MKAESLSTWHSLKISHLLNPERNPPPIASKSHLSRTRSRTPNLSGETQERAREGGRRDRKRGDVRLRKPSSNPMEMEEQY